MSVSLKNSVSRSYLSDPSRFTQIYNNAVFHGAQIVHPEYLTALDTAEIKITGFLRQKMEALWKDRDIHYCMPLRNLLYDTLNLEAQRQRIQEEHRNNKDLAGTEYISGFARNDKLIPVMTLVVYRGEAPWDGPGIFMNFLTFQRN